MEGEKGWKEQGSRKDSKKAKREGAKEGGLKK
jgi:hypothetical protein